MNDFSKRQSGLKSNSGLKQFTLALTLLFVTNGPSPHPIRSFFWSGDSQPIATPTTPPSSATTFAQRIRSTWADALSSSRKTPATPAAKLSWLSQSPSSPATPPKVEPPHQWTAAQARNLARLHWQSGKQVQASARPQNGTIQHLTGWRLEEAAKEARDGVSLNETTALNFLAENQDLFLIDESNREWILADSNQDALGYAQVQFQQHYEGLEVWPASLTVQLNPQGHAHSVFAAYAPTPDHIQTTPTLTAEEALTLALAHVQLEDLPFTRAAHRGLKELLIHAPIGSEPQLAYSVELHQGSGLDWQVFVNAHTGDVLSSINHVCSASVQGEGQDAGGTTQPIELWFEDNIYSLVNTTKPMHDAQRSDPPGFQTTVGGILVFDASNVNPQENPNAFNPQLVTSTASQTGFGPNAVSASINLARVYDYFEARHQRVSIDGQGGNIIGVVNVPINNAYWQNDIITFGSADDWAHALDFAGHEMTHGVIEKTAGLVYQDQPGALNEAFADIFGEAVEAFQSNASPDWKLGTLLAMPLRDMRDPGSLEIGLGRPFPSRMSEFIPPNDSFLDNFSGRDNGGVHLNSSIINHAFYQLAEGLPAAIGIRSAERIFYRALTTKLQKQSQFLDCRIACVQSAEELFGAGATEVQQTAAAFNAVEIFDQRQAPEPTPLPTVTGEDATLFTSVNPFDGLTYLGRREPGQPDVETGTLLVQTPVAPGKRPVVSGDGTVALFVTATFSVAVIDTLTGEGEIIGDPGSVWSVGLSPDGRFLGIVLATNNQPEDVIRVLDLETDSAQEYALLAPALDGGATDTILFADVLNFTPNGEILYYDALNRITFSDGTSIDSWSIYAINRQTGNTISVVPPIPGLSIGNPSLGRSFVDHMVFEASDATTGQSHIFTQDLTTGEQNQVGVIVATAGLAFPDFFGDDQAILYSDYAFNAFGFLAGSGLTRQPLGADGLTANGDPTVWLLGTAGGPTIGTIYRRGAYAGVNTIEVTTATPALEEGSATEAQFVISRTGTAFPALGIEFVITGTTTPGEDYEPIPLSAQFEADQTELTLRIPLLDDALLEEMESLSLNLSPSSNYSLGNALTATIQITDNDDAALTGYALWANEEGVGGPMDDADQDRRPNLVEYAVGSNPNVVDLDPVIRASILTLNGDSYLALTVPRNALRTDVQYGFEVSQDLNTWTDASNQLLGVEDSATQLIVRENGPVGGTTGGFYRLRLTLP